MICNYFDETSVVRCLCTCEKDRMSRFLIGSLNLANSANLDPRQVQTSSVSFYFLALFSYFLLGQKSFNESDVGCLWLNSQW